MIIEMCQEISLEQFEKLKGLKRESGKMLRKKAPGGRKKIELTSIRIKALGELIASDSKSLLQSYS